MILSVTRMFQIFVG